jgi:hypothetical protein
MSQQPDESPAADAFAGFGKFVPGFDFLQNLVTQTAASAAKTTAMGSSSGLQMPGLGGWIAPTMNVEELDRRIKELKAVQFWLDQNATALKATVTALEVQKMTLATLKDMNFNMNEVASAFKAKATEGFASMSPGVPAPAAPAAADKGHAFAGLEVPTTIFGAAAPEVPPAPEPAKEAAAPAADPAAGGVDPMKWWGALTQQFQTIAADAMKDVAEKAAQAAPQQATAMAEKAAASMAATGKTLAAGMAEQASQTMAGGVAAISKALRQQAWPTPAAKKPARATTQAASATAKAKAKPAATTKAKAVPATGRAKVTPKAASRAATVAAKSAPAKSARAPAKKVVARPARKSAR